MSTRFESEKLGRCPLWDSLVHGSNAEMGILKVGNQRGNTFLTNAPKQRYLHRVPRTPRDYNRDFQHTSFIIKLANTFFKRSVAHHIFLSISA